MLKLPNFILIKEIQLFYLEHLILVNRLFSKIISDRYPHYDGVIKVAKRKILFLSQDAYFSVGGLAHATSYPEPLLENDLNFIK